MNIFSEAGPTDLAGRSYPPYVLTDDNQRKWNMAILIAEAVSAAHEPDGQPDHRFVWHTTRTVYNDATIALGPTDQVDAVIAQARQERGTHNS